jgi:hypothetical protein
LVKIRRIFKNGKDDDENYLNLEIDIDNIIIMFKRQVDPAFDVDAPVRKDDSVRDYQYYSYPAALPYSRGRIELQVQDTSKWFLPCEAFIEFEGEMVTNDPANTPYAAEAKIGFVNNGIMALFDNARYLIDGQSIEAIDNNVDVATTIIGLARYSDDYTRSSGGIVHTHRWTTEIYNNNNNCRQGQYHSKVCIFRELWRGGRQWFG